MGEHTLAFLVVALSVFQLGLAFATPKDKRPWTTARQVNVVAGLACTLFLVWLLVEVLV